MTSPPKVAIVNYNNTKPLLVGLEKAHQSRDIALSYHYPSKVAQSLIEEKCDIALVPVASIPLINNAHIVGHYGIASKGEVASVCIFSHVPIHKITHLYLDYQSMTSIRLAQVLIEEYYQLSIEYLQAPEGYIEEIQNTTGGVIIGDRALQHLHNFPFVYDLGALWKEWTGLPFVFALWVSTEAISREFMSLFDSWNEEGLNQLDEVIKGVSMDYYDAAKYFTENIQYRIGDEERAGLALFMSKIYPNYNLTFDT